MNDLPLTIAVFAALAAACWYTRALRVAPPRFRVEARALHERLERLSARNAALSRHLQRTVTRLQFLSQVDAELTDRALDLDALLSALARRVAHAVGDAAGVYLPEPGRPAWRALEGPTPSLQDRAVELLEAAALEPQPAQVRNAMETGRPQARELSGLPCTLAVPLRSRAGQVIGALVLVRRAEAPPYGPEAIALCEQVAERATPAIDVARTYRAREVFATIATRELRARSRLEQLDPQTARLARLVNGEVNDESRPPGP